MSEERVHPFQSHPVLFFYLLAFLISWLGWVPQALHAYGLFPFDHPLLSFLGGAGPTLAAVAVIWTLEGRDGPRKLFAPLFQWRVSWGWYGFVLLYWFVIAAAALGIGALGGQPFPDLDGFAWATLPGVLLTMLLSNLWEEVGWRGFALPRLQGRHTELAIGLFTGLAWSLWHLPLMLNPDSPLSGLPWAWEVVFSLALTVIYIWLYNGTGGSLLPVTLFHALSNTAAYILLALSAFCSTYPLVVSLNAAAAAAIVLYYGPRCFGRTFQIPCLDQD